MKAIVLAAGLGKRLKAGDLKSLTHSGNRSLLEHHIKKLTRAGVSRIAIVIGPEDSIIKEILGDSVAYYVQEKPLGTAHAILCARSFINEPYFLAMNGDIFFTDVLEDFVRLKPPAIATYWVEDTSKYGKLWIKAGKLVEIKEKVSELTPGLINAGIYLFPQGIFEMIKKTPLSPRGVYEITDTIKMLIDKGMQFKIHRLRGYWKDITTASDLSSINEFSINLRR